MTRRFTWFWIAVAALLAIFILFVRPHLRRAETGPARVLKDLHSQAVTNIRVHPKGQPEIHVLRSNDSWQLIEPLTYPAEAARIGKFLNTLEKLEPTTFITSRELKALPKADEEFGFNPPESSVQIEQSDSRFQFMIGSKTAPGDQLFCRVIGSEGLYVVNSALLAALPQNSNSWRQTQFVNLTNFTFDNIAVTNGANMSVLRREGPGNSWRMIFPISARADNAKIEDALARLQRVRIQEFLPQELKPDSELLGLQPPGLELVLRQATNVVAWMQFGKSPTNAAQLAYARVLGQNALVSLPKAPLTSWYGPAYGFRDPHLLSLSQPATMIDVHGLDNFSLERQTNESWRVLPQNFPADADLVKELLSILGGMEVVQFVKEVVVEPDLPTYGLAAPARQYTLKGTTNCPSGPTNQVLAELRFGTNTDDKVYVRRADEDSVYAVKLRDFQALPTASWQLRQRLLWNFTEEDVARATIRQHGKVRQLINKGNHQWTLAPGSQGSIEAFAVDQTVRGLAHLEAVAWAGRGASQRASHGFTNDGHQVTLELKSGEKVSVEFGGQGPTGLQYAGANLDGDFWIFALDSKLYRDVVLYLSVP